MGFKMSLDDVEPWTGGGLILRTGTHPVRVVNEEIKEPGKDGYEGDHPVVILTLEATGGEEKGGEIRDWVHITQEALGRVAQIYEAFGVEVPAGEFEWISLKGRGTVKVIVREKPGRKDPSKTFSEVSSYVAIAESEAAALEHVKQELGATEIEPGSGGKKDDDIPF